MEVRALHYHRRDDYVNIHFEETVGRLPIADLSVTWALKQRLIHSAVCNTVRSHPVFSRPWIARASPRGPRNVNMVAGEVVSLNRDDYISNGNKVSNILCSPSLQSSPQCSTSEMRSNSSVYGNSCSVHSNRSFTGVEMM